MAYTRARMTLSPRAALLLLIALPACTSFEGTDVDSPSDGGQGGAGGAAGAAGESGSGGGGKAGSAGGGGKAGSGNVGGSAGASGGVACKEGEALCGGACKLIEKFLTDPDNCGKCGTQCAAPAGLKPLCVGGMCQLGCEAKGATLCGGVCRDLSSDPDHCGECDKKCETPGGAKATCQAGQCQSGCSGLTECSGQCVDTESDPENCGKCGTVCPASGGGKGVCQGGQCLGQCGEQTLCGGECIDLANDLQNCGACGQACGLLSPEGEPNCAGGQCTASCPPERHACSIGGSSACALDTSAQLCGETCTPCGVGAVCQNGECQAAECPVGAERCGGKCVWLNNDHDNCGKCGKDCSFMTNCKNGQCSDMLLFPCPQDECQSFPQKVCTNFARDPFNCGGCENKCNNNEACLGGKCKPVIRVGEPWECALNTEGEIPFDKPCVVDGVKLCIQHDGQCP